VTKLVDLPGGGTAVFEDYFTSEEIAERVKSHAELAEAGINRSPRAMPAQLAPNLPMVTPVYGKEAWEPPAPRPQAPWSQAYVARKAAAQREAFARVYGRHLGRRSVR
jgi:hypothetical protein